MKYVRVYESDCYPEEYVTTYLNHCEHVANLQDAGFDFEGCIIKQADTIEELCDEFVFIDEFFKREHRLAYSLENALARCKYHDVDITTLRGAIWTDKGLIYVAKMSEKGELELL